MSVEPNAPVGRDVRPPELVITSWEHPRRGRVQELNCQLHTTQLLAALRVLGIGCIGEPGVGVWCGRCNAEDEGVEARFYLGLAGAR